MRFNLKLWAGLRGWKDLLNTKEGRRIGKGGTEQKKKIKDRPLQGH